MPVLINDLEVELQNPSTENETETRPPVENPDQGRLSPSDLSIILKQQAERQERVRSH